ncbi:MAG: clostripain-related cysteine peptidase [Elusimicrobiaceae bacterium]|nr:clostripain-related cysteine peptidase [Elusimicrobiaceae bacterium]
MAIKFMRSVLLAAAISLPAPYGFALPPDENTHIPGTINSFAGQSAPARETKDVTVMVYMNARNELDRAAAQDIRDLAKNASGHAANIVVEFGIVGKPITRSYMTPAGFETVARIPTGDMGDYRELASFLSWSKKNFPARQYLLVIWGHGSGWTDLYPDKAASKGISYDYQTSNYIKTAELKNIFAIAGPVDVLVLNACRMQSAEVLFELRDCARFVVGSQLNIPVNSVNLARLTAIAATPGLSPKQLAVNIAKGSMRACGAPLSFSAIDMAELKKLPRYLDPVVRSMEQDVYAIRTLYKNSFRVDPAQQPGTVDLYSLAATLADRPAPANAMALRDYLSNQVIAANFAIGTKARGLSIELPYPEHYNAARYKMNYSTLALGRESNWGEFLKKIGKAR